jgi:hypothetical protein
MCAKNAQGQKVIVFEKMGQKVIVDRDKML